ncbi:hypothetical protein ACFQMA_16140 [Halosimplex aquaticum]|uniref:Rod shape-determining protein MreD n=1 Tax=Halosimplex aquaticum TaxID=3026162 RepID=A0ABD5Y7P4_9EURY|nr:hypothetical protein [Halosimplex aquaticum]
MATESRRPPGASDRPERGPGPMARNAMLGAASAVLFILGLLITESFGETAVDVDLKPFFAPYLLIAVARFGIPTLSVGLGAALGEGVIDVFEGYELDDPVGFIGYVVGFTAFGWYVHEVSTDPRRPRSLLVGATLGAFVQAAFEGVAYLAFEASAGYVGASVSVVGNTAAHGVILGGLPLVVLLPRVSDRLERFVA